MGKRLKKKTKLCDPSACDECQYIGEGDFLCDRYLEIVVSDWEPTKNYRMCTLASAEKGDSRACYPGD